MVQWKDCGLTTKTRIRLITRPSAKPQATPSVVSSRLRRRGCQHLAARHADVAQHAEFAGARQRLRREGGGHARQADDDGDRFQQVGDGEAAVENLQAHGADFAGARQLQGALPKGSARSAPSILFVRCAWAA
jgi:hypothetical protein